MVCICAFDLETSSDCRANAFPQMRRGYQASRLLVHHERQRSFSYVAASQVLKLKEERGERVPDSNHFHKALFQHNVRAKFDGSVVLSIVAPDRLIELSGTPPPALLI